MKATGLALAFGLVGLAGSASAETILVDQNARITHAFVLLQAQMVDPATFFQRYAVPAEVEVARYGGQALLGTPARQVIEGRWDGNWTLVLRFPSLKAIDAWYRSQGYQAVLPWRHQATAWGQMVAMEGLPESGLDWRVDRQDGVTARVSLPATLDPTPELVVTADARWTARPGRFAISAGFAPQDLSHARLQVEVSGSDTLVGQTLEVMPMLRDEAGHRTRLPRQGWTVQAGQVWQSMTLRIPPAAPQGGDDDGHAQPRRIQAIEFEFAPQAGSRPAAGQIRIRNLKVSR